MLSVHTVPQPAANLLPTSSHQRTRQWQKDSMKYSIDFVFNRFFMKLFRTSSNEIVKESQCYFGINLPSVVLQRRMEKFEHKFRLHASYLRRLSK